VTLRRPATRADVDGIVAMGERFRAQSAYASIVVWNPEQIRALTERLIDGAPESVVLVAECCGDLVGMLAALVYDHHISGARVAGEVVWWVDPDQRGTLGIRLLKDAERWARSRGAETFEMIAPTARVEEIYFYLGYQPVERTFIRRL
jgi:GNAT superfamily N-acetyltransferase